MTPQQRLDNFKDLLKKEQAKPEMDPIIFEWLMHKIHDLEGVIRINSDEEYAPTSQRG